MWPAYTASRPPVLRCESSNSRRPTPTTTPSFRSHRVIGREPNMAGGWELWDSRMKPHPLLTDSLSPPGPKESPPRAGSSWSVRMASSTGRYCPLRCARGSSHADPSRTGGLPRRRYRPGDGGDAIRWGGCSSGDREASPGCSPIRARPSPGVRPGRRPRGRSPGARAGPASGAARRALHGRAGSGVASGRAVEAASIPPRLE